MSVKLSMTRIHIQIKIHIFFCQKTPPVRSAKFLASLKGNIIIFSEG